MLSKGSWDFYTQLSQASTGLCIAVADAIHDDRITCSDKLVKCRGAKCRADLLSGVSGDDATTILDFWRSNAVASMLEEKENSYSPDEPLASIVAGLLLMEARAQALAKQCWPDPATIASAGASSVTTAASSASTAQAAVNKHNGEEAIDSAADEGEAKD